MNCDWYKTALEQREHEIARGKGTKGTAGYERMGCYDCNGMDFNCEIYREQIFDQAGGRV